jgi:hypothetical protein
MRHRLRNLLGTWVERQHAIEMTRELDRRLSIPATQIDHGQTPWRLCSKPFKESRRVSWSMRAVVGGMAGKVILE